jgi:hypothetical protein
MSLEEALKANTAALIAMTAALAAGAGVSAAAAATTTPKPAKEKPAETPAGSKHTRTEMNALLTEYKDKTDSVEKVRALMGAKKMADVPDDQIDAVFEKATAALAKLAEEDDGV